MDEQHPRDEASISRQKPRKPWLALLSSVFWPGLGQLYAGAPFRAVVALVVYICLLLPLVGLIRALFSGSVAAFVVGIVSMIVVLYLLVPVDAWWTAKRRRLEPLTRWNRVWIYVGYAVLVAILVRLAFPVVEASFPIRAFRIPAGAMMDTLLEGDVVLVDMRHGRLRSLERGDVVVFDHPLEPPVLYVKRLIGLPGETIEVRSGIVYIDQERLEEPYVNPDYRRGVRDFGPYTVQGGHYFVLGDHRNASYDSRDWGTVPEARLRGKVLRVYYSVARGPVSLIGRVRWERTGRSIDPDGP